MKLPTSAAMTVVILISLALTSCTIAAPPMLSGHTGEPSSVYPDPPKISSKSHDKPSALPPSWAPQEKLIASFTSQHTAMTVGPYSTRTGFIAVYINCVGKGDIEVSIPGSAGYTSTCSPDDSEPGIRNTSHIPASEKFTVNVKSSDLWSLTISEISQPEMDINSTPSG
ncbi:hypothetical protein [Psychromicrobium sp. YIM B11713]|uniref:hypothetical protein n=1 Tax=Psychromicrobium sp. YIM B11713 TaxID=3145233 RepID=UPI00374EF450